MDKKKIFAIVLFLLMGFFMFTFANPTNELEKIEDNEQETEEKENVKINNKKQQPVINELNVLNQQIQNVNEQQDEKDNLAPSITLEPKKVTLLEGENYDVMENVKAIDEIDGEVKVTASITDITNLKPGKYEIIYEAEDKSGNKSTEKREIVILSKTGDEDNDGYSNEEEIEYKTDFNDEKSTPDYSNKPALNLENMPTSIVVYDTLTREEILNKISATREFYNDLVLDIDITNIDFYNAGTYKVYVSATDILGNKTEEEVLFNVLKRKVSIKIDDKNSSYLEEIQPLTSNEQDNIYKGQKIGVILSTEATKEKEVGNYEITGSYKNKNYDVTFINGNYSITGRILSKEEIKEEFKNQEFIYDKLEHSILFEDTDNYEVSYENNGRTEVGSQTVLVTLNGKGNYEGTVTLEVELKIVPKEIEVNWENLEFTYDGNSHVPTATYEDLEIKVTGEKINAGTYEAKAYTNSNYKIINDTETFVIKKATPKYVVPSNLSCFEYESLYDVKLDENFKFEEENKSLVEGTYETTVKYIPKDTDNYEIVTNIKVSIEVKPRYFEVKFFDYNKNQIGMTQNVRYHESATSPKEGFESRIELNDGTILVNPTWDKDYSDIVEDTNVFIKYTKLESAKTKVYILKDNHKIPDPIYAPNGNEHYDLVLTDIKIKDDSNGSLAKVIEQANNSSTNEAYLAVGDDVYNYLTNESKQKLNELVLNKNYTIKYYVLKYVKSSGWHLDGYRIYEEVTTPSIIIENKCERVGYFSCKIKTHIKTDKEIASVIIKHDVFNYKKMRWEEKTTTLNSLKKQNNEYVFDYIENTKTIKITFKKGTNVTYKYVNGIYEKED